MRIVKEHKFWWLTLYAVAVALVAVTYIRTGARHPGGPAWDIATIAVTGMAVLLLCAAVAGIVALLAWPVRRRLPSGEGFLGVVWFILMFIGLLYVMGTSDIASHSSDGARLTEARTVGMWEAMERRDLRGIERLLDDGASPVVQERLDSEASRR